MKRRTVLYSRREVFLAEWIAVWFHQEESTRLYKNERCRAFYWAVVYVYVQPELVVVMERTRIWLPNKCFGGHFSLRFADSRFQTTALVVLSFVFWIVTQRKVVWYWRFGNTYRSRLPGSRGSRRPLKCWQSCDSSCTAAVLLWRCSQTVFIVHQYHICHFVCPWTLLGSLELGNSTVSKKRLNDCVRNEMGLGGTAACQELWSFLGVWLQYF